MNTTEIIQTLGGTFAVAKLCRVSPPAVSQWRNNGLPGDKLVLLAAELEKKSPTGNKSGLSCIRLIKPLASRNSSMIRVVFH